MVYRISEHKGIVEIWSSGIPICEFLWSEEMVDACIFLMESVNFSDVNSQPLSLTISTQPETRNTHINIGTEKEISIPIWLFLLSKP